MPRRLLRGLGGLSQFVFGLQLFGGFAPGGIEGDAGDRADLLALRLIEVADAFGATIGVDLVNLRAHKNGVVGAFRLANVAVDAVIRNQ